MLARLEDTIADSCGADFLALWLNSARSLLNVVKSWENNVHGLIIKESKSLSVHNLKQKKRVYWSNWVRSNSYTLVFSFCEHYCPRFCSKKSNPSLQLMMVRQQVRRHWDLRCGAKKGVTGAPLSTTLLAKTLLLTSGMGLAWLGGSHSFNSPSRRRRVYSSLPALQPYPTLGPSIQFDGMIFLHICLYTINPGDDAAKNYQKEEISIVIYFNEQLYFLEVLL